MSNRQGRQPGAENQGQGQQNQQDQTVQQPQEQQEDQLVGPQGDLDPAQGRQPQPGEQERKRGQKHRQP